MDARGDIIGPGGKIVKKREEVMADYYETNPKAIQQEPQVSTTLEYNERPSKRNK